MECNPYIALNKILTPYWGDWFTAGNKTYSLVLSREEGEDIADITRGLFSLIPFYEPARIRKADLPYSLLRKGRANQIGRVAVPKTRMPVQNLKL